MRAALRWGWSVTANWQLRALIDKAQSGATPVAT
jgi:hypothetical protein